MVKYNWEAILSAITEMIETDRPPFTLRQMHYRCVARLAHLGGYWNNKNAYSALSARTVRWRNERVIEPVVMEDRTRGFNDYAYTLFETWEEQMECNMESMLNAKYYRPENWGQQDFTLIVCEKRALETILIDEIRNSFGTNSNIFYVTCAGYNSYSQLYKLAETVKRRMSRVNDARLHLRQFGDYDPSGLDILRSLRKRLVGFGLDFDTAETCGLTPAQIGEFDLHGVPAKTTDSRTSNWNGDEVVELDALPPSELRALIRDCRVWDEDIAKETEERFSGEQEKYDTAMAEFKEFMKERYDL